MTALPNDQTSTDDPAPEVTPDPVPAEEFHDIAEVPWAKDAIEQLTAAGILNGTGDGMFEPQRKITREEFAKVVVEALDITAASSEQMHFTDCSPDDWFYPYLQVLYANEIVRGMDDHTFGVGYSISRQDLSVICLRLLEYTGTLPADVTDANFVDMASVAPYARTAVSALAKTGIVNGNADGSFNPAGGTTRAEAAVIMSRMLAYIAQVSQ